MTSHQLNISNKQIEKYITKGAKKVIAESGIQSSTRKGNKELAHFVKRLARYPKDLKSATQIGEELGQKIVHLSHQLGRTYLDQGVIRKLAISEPNFSLPASTELPIAASDFSEALPQSSNSIADDVQDDLVLDQTEEKDTGLDDFNDTDDEIDTASIDADHLLDDGFESKEEIDETDKEENEELYEDSEDGEYDAELAQDKEFEEELEKSEEDDIAIENILETSADQSRDEEIEDEDFEDEDEEVEAELEDSEEELSAEEADDREIELVTTVEDDLPVEEAEHQPLTNDRTATEVDEDEPAANLGTPSEKPGIPAAKGS